MTELLARLWCKLSLHQRRIAQKRRLEAILHAHGIGKHRATQITNHFLSTLKVSHHDS
jgi:hypothetical protein